MGGVWGGEFLFLLFDASFFCDNFLCPRMWIGLAY